MSALAYAVILQFAANPACTVPGMVPEFWPKVVTVESGYDPFALHDDQENREYHPKSADDAEALATRLMAQGHSVGVGLSQLTARSPAEFWAKFRMTIGNALNPCANMKAGATHYVTRSLAIYNSGSPESARGIAYAEKVLASVGSGTGREVTLSLPTASPVAINRHAADTEVWERPSSDISSALPPCS